MEEQLSTSPEPPRLMTHPTDTKCPQSTERLRVLEMVSKQRLRIFPTLPWACIATQERSISSLVANSAPKQHTTRTPTVPSLTVRTLTIPCKSLCIGTFRALSFALLVDWYVVFIDGSKKLLSWLLSHTDLLTLSFSLFSKPNIAWDQVQYQEWRHLA